LPDCISVLILLLKALSDFDFFRGILYLSERIQEVVHSIVC
jgi:hypothetical protein